MDYNLKSEEKKKKEKILTCLMEIVESQGDLADDFNWEGEEDGGEWYCSARLSLILIDKENWDVKKPKRMLLFWIREDAVGWIGKFGIWLYVSVFGFSENFCVMGGKWWRGRGRRRMRGKEEAKF